MSGLEQSKTAALSGLERAVIGNVREPVMEVNGHIEPEAVYENNLGGVADVAALSEYTVVVRRDFDGLQIYDKQGKVVPLDFDGSPFGVNVDKLFEAIAKDGKEYIRYRGGSTWDSCIDVKSAIEAINEPSALAAPIADILCRNAGDDDMKNKNKLMNVFGRFVPCYPSSSSLHLDSTGSILSIKAGRCITSFKVQSPSGAPLHPSKWERTDVYDMADITLDLIEDKPHLAPFLTSKNGTVFPEGKFRFGVNGGILTIYENGLDVCVFSDKAVNAVVHPKNHNKLIYVRPDSNELVTLETTALGLGRNPITVRPLPVQEEVVDVKIDPFGNYLLVSGRAEGDSSSLHIIDLESGNSACLPVEGVRGPIEPSPRGDILFEDGEGRLRRVATNLEYLSEGGRDHVRRARVAHLSEIERAVEEIRLPRLPEEKDAVDPVTQQLAETIRRIQEKLAVRFEPLLEAVKNPDDLNRLQRQIGILEQRPEFSQYPQLFDTYKDQICKKGTQFRITALQENLTQLRDDLQQGVSGSHEEITEVISRMQKLEKERRELRIDNREVRKEVQALLQETRREMSATLESFRQEMESHVEDLKTVLYVSINSTESMEELEAVLSEDAWGKFDSICRLSGSEARSQEWRKELDAVWERRQIELQKEEDSAERQVANQQSRVLGELKSLRLKMSASLERIESNVELASWRISNPLLKSFVEMAAGLPESLNEREMAVVERLLKDREQALMRRGTVKLKEQNGMVNFGGQQFPVFSDYSVLPTPEVIPSYRGASVGRLTFVAHGRRYEVPGTFPIDLRTEEVQEAILQHKDKAREYFEIRRRQVPEFRDNWTINEYVLGNLSEVSRLLNIQQKLGQGILILEGEAGVGKNVLVDIFGHFTNREVFTFSCNQQTEKEDLTQAFMFDPERGTYRASSELVEALQTPGSLIIFDEINTLQPGVSKLLNSLFDYRRALYLPHEAGEIKANDVLFLGAMNLRHYIGTKQLPQEFVSRSRIKQIDYPPEQIGGRFTPYEAEILASHIDALKDLSQEEFYRAWDWVVNNDKSNGADVLLSPEREKSIREIQHVVKVANVIRSAYKAYQTEESPEEVNFIFSIRETEWIAAEINFGMDATQAIRDVVLPKVTDHKERDRVDTIIGGV